MNKLGIVVAMEVEAKSLIDLLHLERVDGEENMYEKKEGLGKFSHIFVIVSDIGMENSAISTQYLILKYGVNQIINIGYAGSNILNIGTIVSPNIVFNWDFDLSALGYEKYKIPRVEDLKLDCISKYENAPCYCANHFVTSSDREEATIYDMELHGIALVSHKYKVPISALKIVTDCLDEKVYNQSESDIEFSTNLANAVLDYINSDKS